MTYNKYHVSDKENRTFDGIVFDSKKEMLRYAELKLMVRGKLISDLKLQPSFDLQEKFKFQGETIHPIKYFADFSYFDIQKKKWIIEDVKGMKTKEYMLKLKILKYNMKDREDLIIRET